MAKNALSIARELNLREQMAYVLSDLGWAYNRGLSIRKSRRKNGRGSPLMERVGQYAHVVEQP